MWLSPFALRVCTYVYEYEIAEHWLLTCSSCGIERKQKDVEGKESVCNRSYSQPCAPRPQSTSVFYILSRWSSTSHNWVSVLSRDVMPKSIVPKTQFGLKLPRSCLKIYHREASIQRKHHLFLLPTLMTHLSPPEYGWSGLSIFDRWLVRAMCLSANR